MLDATTLLVVSFTAFSLYLGEVLSRYGFS